MYSKILLSIVLICALVTITHLINIYQPSLALQSLFEQPLDAKIIL